MERLQGLGAEIVRGDLKDRSSLDAACQGIQAVVSTASSTLSRLEGDSIESVDRDGQLGLIDAAKAAGVDRFALVSFPNMNVEFPLQTAKREVELQLRESGMTYTILQPSFFMEVWLSPALGFDFANATAQIYGSGQNKISWISYQDVARFAVAALDNPTAKNAVIELGGPEALSPMEVVRIFEDLLGKKFKLQQLSEEQLRTQKEGATESLSESFAGLMLACAQGNVIDMREVLERFPMPLGSVREYVRKMG